MEEKKVFKEDKSALGCKNSLKKEKRHSKHIGNDTLDRNGRE